MTLPATISIVKCALKNDDTLDDRQIEQVVGILMGRAPLIRTSELCAMENISRSTFLRMRKANPQIQPAKRNRTYARWDYKEFKRVTSKTGDQSSQP